MAQKAVKKSTRGEKSVLSRIMEIGHQLHEVGGVLGFSRAGHCEAALLPRVALRVLAGDPDVPPDVQAEWKLAAQELLSPSQVRTPSYR